MRRAIAIVVLALLAGAHYTSAQGESQTIRITVQGETNLKLEFLESLRDEGKKSGIAFEVTPRAQADYNVLVAQETRIGSAAAAVMVTDKGGDFVASVVRSGRWTGRGALNASAKELIKKLTAIRGR